MCQKFKQSCAPEGIFSFGDADFYPSNPVSLAITVAKILCAKVSGRNFAGFCLYFHCGGLPKPVPGESNCVVFLCRTVRNDPRDPGSAGERECDLYKSISGGKKVWTIFVEFYWLKFDISTLEESPKCLLGAWIVLFFCAQHLSTFSALPEVATGVFVTALTVPFEEKRSGAISLSFTALKLRI